MGGGEEEKGYIWFADLTAQHKHMQTVEREGVMTRYRNLCSGDEKLGHFK
jgi:hypothetical protein